MKKRMEAEFIPMDDFIKTLKYWWIIVLFMLGGVVTGFVVHTICPPIYESQAEITTSINFVQTGVLTDEQQDQAVGAVGDLIRSTEVINIVLKKITDENISISTLKSLQKVVFVERQEYLWRIRVQMKDPETATTVVNIWAKEALFQLQAASMHALLADNLTDNLSNIENCLVSSSIVMPVYQPCEGKNVESIKGEIGAISSRLQNEKRESKGIIPEMTFYINEVGQIPSSPVSFNRSLLVFGFGILGFCLGVAFLHTLQFHVVKKK